MGPPRKRVSYIIPAPSERPPLLQLPALGVPRSGATGPLLIPSTSRSDRVRRDVSSSPHRPRHRLGIASLALDTSTKLVGRNAPEGILYSGGRDGLIMSWDLSMPLKRRKKNDIGSGRKQGGRWEILTGWGDNAIDEETDDDEHPISDGDVLGEVTNRRRRATISANDIPYERQWETDLSAFVAGTPTHFRQYVQAHSDWVNDILLCNYNQTIISASSDGTLKAWNPHATTLEDPSTIGSHSDYVRCLTHSREHNWIASGSFDRTIKLWDLNSDAKSPLVTLNPPDSTAPKLSVYALAVDPFGQTIASGSPERVVRLWDPRTGKRTGKLVGHTDNIRAILVSADSRYLLTGSADASVKLWSLVSQQCLHTFAHHTESVWSLYSDHPSLEVFYSGDRSGLVCRVDVEDCTDISEGECVLLCHDSPETSRTASEGINKMVVMDDNVLWAASGTSTLKRWHIPQRRTTRPATYILDSDGDRLSQSTCGAPHNRRSLPLSDPTESDMRLRAGHIYSGTLSVAHSLQSLTSEPSRDREVKWSSLPYDSLIKLVSADDPFPHFNARTRDPEVATLYSAASVMSVPRQNVVKSTSPFVHPSHVPHLVHSSRTEDTVILSNTARAKYEERELAADAIPICTEPDFVILGDAGLVRCIVLNDRIHALAVDTLGEVGVWDVIRGVCLGCYPPDEVAATSHSSITTDGSGEKERSPRESLESVRERIEGEAVVLPWCMADTKAGLLTIHLMERCFDAEVYADEVGFANDRHFSDESKLNLGKWVLRNLFIGFLREEIRCHSIRRGDGYSPSLSRASSRDVLEHNAIGHDQPSLNAPESQSKFSSGSTTLVCSPTMERAVIPNVPIVARASSLTTTLIPLHPQPANINVLPSIPQSPSVHVPSAPGLHSRTRSGATDGSLPTSDPKDDYFSARLRHSAGSAPLEDPAPVPPAKTEPSTPMTPSGLMGRLRNFGRTKRPPSDTPAITTPTTETHTLGHGVPDVVEIAKTPVQMLVSGQLNPAGSTDAPTLPEPPNATILISDEGSPSYTIVYRGLVSNCHNNVEALEKVMPMWLAEYLLLNHVPPIAPQAKISFILVPWNRDPDVEPLPELLNTQQSKLTAHRNLRIRKILGHVQERFDKMTSNSRAPSIRSSFEGHPRSSNIPTRSRAEDVYELLCNEAVVPLGMTLVAVRQYMWKSSAELVMYYRKKKKSSS